MPSTAVLTYHEKILKPSPQFKKETAKALFAIVSFIIVYIVLFTAALALAAGCVYAGLFIIVKVMNWISLLLGGGLMGLGVMVFIFIVKFIFDTTKEDVSDSIEITAVEQPALVAFIHGIAKETGTAKPKKIFLSHDVNASVFYHSSFWSMFLPVKKNLKIGLGLMNAINIAEFKAVIAHEFGHFSQRSMKVGSFVYNVNRIIFNMLYRNTGYSNTLSGFASVHAVFTIFAQLTALIVQGIQWVLQQMYKFVNVSYMALSREMEFHADLVSASVSGSNNIVSSLKRISFADGCFQETLNAYDKLWKEDKRAGNIYEDHKTVLLHFAQVNRFELAGGLPVLPANEAERAGQRINIKDQWASHPSIAEREAFLQKYNLIADVDDTPAMSLLQNPNALKQQLTQHIYRDIDADGKRTIISNADFETFYSTGMNHQYLPDVFEGYYDNRVASTIEQAEITTLPTPDSFSDIFTTEIKNLPGKVKALEADIAVLKAITAKEINTRTFDFDGIKQNRKHVPTVLTELENDLTKNKKVLADADNTLEAFFYKQAMSVSPAEADALMGLKKSFAGLRKEADDYLLFLQQMMELMQPLFNTLANEKITAILKNVQSKESKLKAELQHWQERGAFEKNPIFLADAEKYLQSNHAYFNGTRYFDHEMQQLTRMIQEGWAEVDSFVFAHYRVFLEKQASLLHLIKQG
jgi:Zn-dependent protease with chaperone function